MFRLSALFKLSGMEFQNKALRTAMYKRYINSIIIII